jgi:predicted regulator of Ras-like GTPase activity (Roadblock/LC7/MglB family)
MMLRSLFGDLAPPRESARAGMGETDAHGFASTAILEGEDGSGEQGQAADRHLRELLVNGSPANAIRAHFARTNDDRADGERFVTLFDPAQMWAGAMIKALSDASGQPVERLQLRDQYSLATLAVIERTMVPRRQDETLKIYHADVHTPGAEMVAISTALMERSDLVSVVVGPMHPAAIDAMIEMLSDACAGQTWRCPQVLFMLPVGALWIAQKIAATAWPASVQVHTLSEPLTSASAVWNKLLSHWGRVRPAGAASTDYGSLEALAQSAAKAASRASTTSGTSSSAPGDDVTSTSERQQTRQETGRPVAVLLDHSTGDGGGAFALQLPPAAEPLAPASNQRVHRLLDAEKANRVMHDLLQLDGVIIAVLVDGNTGHVLASDGSSADIERAAQAAAEIMRTHRRTLRMMGHWRPSDPVDEVLVTAGGRYHVMRALHHLPEHFVLAVLDKLRCNLATTRFRIMEAQQSLS